MADESPQKTLGDLVPRRRFALRCSQCGRKGSYGLATLIRALGPEILLPDVPRAVARWRGCPYVDNVVLGAAAWCGVHIDLDELTAEWRAAKQAERHRR